MARLRAGGLRDGRGGARHAALRARVLGGASDSVQCVVPWAYPPAFADEVVAAETLGVERALTGARAAGESRFEAEGALDERRARARAAQAGDRGRRRPRCEREPTDSTLFAPGPSVRYGAKYFAMMLARGSPGSPPVALVAYNAGPNAMPRTATCSPAGRRPVLRIGHERRLAGLRPAHHRLPSGLPGVRPARRPLTSLVCPARERDPPPIPDPLEPLRSPGWLAGRAARPFISGW